MPTLAFPNLSENDILIYKICQNRKYLTDEQLQNLLQHPFFSTRGLLFLLQDVGILNEQQAREVFELRNHSLLCPNCQALNTIQSNDTHIFCCTCNCSVNIAEIIQKEHRQTLVVGQQIKQYNNYRILEEIGRGNMGIVYKAIDEQLNRIVALKILKKMDDSETMQAMENYFNREARSIAQLNHPSIVQIYDKGEVLNERYIAMEFIEGRNLSYYVKKEIQYTDKIRILIQIAEGLENARIKEIIHRDIKPDNIMITPEGHVKITDFGLAKSTAGIVQQTLATLGTPIYMSPEQIECKKLDHRSDLYALGTLMYELLTGIYPFYDRKIHTLTSMILKDKPRPPREIKSSIPKGLEAICLKLLQKNPDERYQAAYEVFQTLQQQLPKNYQYPSESFQEMLKKSKTIRVQAITTDRFKLHQNNMQKKLTPVPQPILPIPQPISSTPILPTPQPPPEIPPELLEILSKEFPPPPDHSNKQEEIADPFEKTPKLHDDISQPVEKKPKVLHDQVSKSPSPKLPKKYSKPEPVKAELEPSSELESSHNLQMEPSLVSVTHGGTRQPPSILKQERIQKNRRPVARSVEPIRPKNSTTSTHTHENKNSISTSKIKQEEDKTLQFEFLIGNGANNLVLDIFDIVLWVGIIIVTFYLCYSLFIV